MKTKLLFSKIQNFKNGIFTFLIIFLMTISSFSQSEGIIFTCGDVTISFGTPEADKFNEYPYWVGGTDNVTSDQYLLIVQDFGGLRWEVHKAVIGGDFPNNPDEIGQLFFYSYDFNDISPVCDLPGGADPPPVWNIVAALPCSSITGNCIGDPIEVCPTYYADVDEDGFGDPDNSIDSCTGAPTGFIEDDTDCNDNDATVTNTIWYTGVDADADTFIGSVTALTQCDSPGAGYSTTALTITDCNDNDATVNTEQEYFVDNDEDGFGSTTTAMICASTPPLGYSLTSDDCDDTEPLANPGLEEIPFDVIDNDCDGETDEDDTPPNVYEYCDDQQKKILICHNRKTKCVSINAKDAHLAHGDYLGSCGGNSREGEIDISEENSTTYDVVSWPNPSNNLFNLKMITPNSIDKVNIKAFDINGRLIHSNIINGNEDYQFGDQLSSGVYFVRLSQANIVKVIKVIKQ